MSRSPASAIPDPTPPIDVAAAAKLYAKGLTYVDIGAKLGYRPSSIRRRLRRHGVRRIKKRSRHNEKWGKQLYNVWIEMRRRGRERDIEVSEKWNSFDAFYDWARSSGYRPRLLLRRRREKGAYAPGNCAWAVRKRPPVKRTRVNPGKRLTETEWKLAERLHVQAGLSCPAIARRLHVSYTTIIRGLKLRGCHVPPSPGVTRRTSDVETQKLHKSWSRMRQRCYNVRDHAYRYYGAKGARVCREWNDFNAFYEWALAAGWKPNLCLTRRQGLSFSPANCKWVTRTEAARGGYHPSAKMPPRWTLTAFGETKGPTAWSRDRRCAVTLASLLVRLRKGWDPESAITTPPQSRGGKPRYFVTAFGETKSPTQWTLDRRCSVTLVTLLQRLDHNVPPEEAIAARAFQFLLSAFPSTRVAMAAPAAPSSCVRLRRPRACGARDRVGLRGTCAAETGAGRAAPRRLLPDLKR